MFFLDLLGFDGILLFMISNTISSTVYYIFMKVEKFQNSIDARLPKEMGTLMWDLARDLKEAIDGIPILRIR